MRDIARPGNIRIVALDDDAGVDRRRRARRRRADIGIALVQNRRHARRHRRNARTVVQEEHLPTEVDTCRCVISVRIRDRRGKPHEIAAKRNRLADVGVLADTLVDRTILRQCHIAGRSVHRKREHQKCRLSFVAGHIALDDIAALIEHDSQTSRAVDQGRRRTIGGNHRRIGNRRPVGALHRRECGAIVFRLRGLRNIGSATVDAVCRGRQEALVDHKSWQLLLFAKDFSLDARTIVQEAHLLAKVDARSLMVAVHVGDRRRQRHQVGDAVQADPFADIGRRIR